jgi:electron transfer flavoprotein beta subunit
MALGCDKAIHIVVPDADAPLLEPLAIAKALAKIHEEFKPDIWLLGKQAVDGDFGVTPQLLAGLIDVPQGTYASEVTVKDGKIRVMREIDAGRQVVELSTPCVLAADLRLNQPRFPNLQAIMKARKKPIDTRTIESLSVDAKPRLLSVKVEEPPTRKAGVKVKTVEELYAKLKTEAKAL